MQDVQVKYYISKISFSLEKLFLLKIGKHKMERFHTENCFCCCLGESETYQIKTNHAVIQMHSEG